MKKIILFPVLMFFVSSCQDNEMLSKLIGETQKLSIYVYKNEGNKRTKNFILETDKKEEIEKLAGYISDENSPDYKCGYDGIIELKTTKGDVNMEFNLHNECKHIVFTFENKRYTKKLTQDGWEFLRDLYNK